VAEALGIALAESRRTPHRSGTLRNSTHPVTLGRSHLPRKRGRADSFDGVS